MRVRYEDESLTITVLPYHVPTVYVDMNGLCK